MAPESASDIDGWIAEAGKIQADLAQSQSDSVELSNYAQIKETHRANIQDCVVKTSFLYSEIGYSSTLSRIMTSIYRISRLIDKIIAAVADNDILGALSLLGKANKRLKRLSLLENTQAIRDLRAELDRARNDIVEVATSQWNQWIKVDIKKREIEMVPPIQEAARKSHHQHHTL